MCQLGKWSYFRVKRRKFFLHLLLSYSILFTPKWVISIYVVGNFVKANWISRSVSIKMQTANFRQDKKKGSCIQGSTLVPEVFLEIFLRGRESESWSGDNESRSSEERENNLLLPYLTFVQMTRSGSDPLWRWLVDMFRNMQINIWLIRLTVTTEGMLRIFFTSFLLVNFASLYQGRKLFVK